ncbi:MAG: pyridoxal 5'-phosphate synthase glutaminase subunit PdxT [Aquiluna sp.]
MRVGVLALQGDVREHIATLESLGATAFPVKTLAELEMADGLVIPGGESTTISKLLVNFGLMDAVRKFAENQPVLGTCAGLILLSNRVAGALADQQLIGGLPVAVERNAYGGQTHSFETEVVIAGESERVAFIRAPRILDSGDAEVIAELNGEPVAVKAGNLMGASFHPEITGGKRLHRVFLELIEKMQAG